MQFEKIRTINKRKMIIGGVIILGVISALIYLPSKAKYKTTENFNIVNGTINYKVPDLKVMAMYQENDTGIYDEITDMPSSGYVINEDKTYCTTDNVTQVKGKIKSENGKITLQSLAKGDKCYLYFDKKISIDSVSELLDKVKSEVKTGTPTFSNIAETDEGVFSVADPVYGGTSYYYRGAVTNNYVLFANFCWRIIRINGDGTIRMIYDGAVCHANGQSTEESVIVANQVYNSYYNRSEYVGYTYTEGSQRILAGTASNLKTQTDSWFSASIAGANAEKVADGKFCNDRNTASGYTWSASGSTFYYAAKERLESTKTPTLACDIGDIYTLKAGAITADEVSFAGGVFGKSNNKYYLYNGLNYWSATPYSWDSRRANIFFVVSNGSLNFFSAIDYSNVRPVINLRSDTVFSSGDGTIDSPFTVK